MSTPHHATLSNGIQIVLEPIPHRRSVALGVWMARGSRHEAAMENGMTHFCEHLLFKGTPSQGWKDIGRRMNRLGGNFNAMTSSEWVKLYGQVITRDVEEAMGLLSEMFLIPTFPKEEVDREREVILEEIAQYEDLPDELCGERLLAELLLPHPLGRPVIGTDELVESFTRDALSHYWARSIEHDPLLVSMAGDLEIEPTIALCERLLGHLPVRPAHRLIEEPVRGGHGVALIDRDLEQVNFGLAMIGARRNSEDRFAWAVYDTILGGGMGSRGIWFELDAGDGYVADFVQLPAGDGSAGAGDLHRGNWQTGCGRSYGGGAFDGATAARTKPSARSGIDRLARPRERRAYGV
jgi:predicted Zn-dependent peptidase